MNAMQTTPKPWPQRRPLFVAAVLSLAVFVEISYAPGAAGAAEEPKAATTEKAASFPESTAAPLMEIAGLRVGQTVAEACAKLDPIGERMSRTSKDRGDRYLWKLKDEKADLAYVSVRSNREGKIGSITGFYRTGHEVPFEKIGDLDAVGNINDERAFWDVRDASGKLSHRISAKGAQRKANVITLVSVPKRNRAESEIAMTPEQLRGSIDETDKAR